MTQIGGGDGAAEKRTGRTSELRREEETQMKMKVNERLAMTE